MQSISENTFRRQENDYYRIFWEKTAQGGAKVLRILGQLPAVTVPDEIDGYPVTELGDYCFSRTAHLPDRGYFVSDISVSEYNLSNKDRNDDYANAITELCGSYVESVCLPDSLVKIGNYAFYNCRNLNKLEIGHQCRTFGSDAFMNCYKLQQIDLRCNALESSSLQKILVQISWDVEVSFTGQCKPASLFYPEYYETYDEIAPAHIFERRIAGGGFSARQCFLNHKVDYAKYDSVFLQASNAESRQTMWHLSLCRLRYPVCLSSQADIFYRNYISSHEIALVRYLTEQKALDVLEFLFQEKLISQEAIQTAVLSASSAGWAEGCACMMRWQQSGAGGSIMDRYSFD